MPIAQIQPAGGGTGAASASRFTTASAVAAAAGGRDDDPDLSRERSPRRPVRFYQAGEPDLEKLVEKERNGLDQDSLREIQMMVFKLTDKVSKLQNTQQRLLKLARRSRATTGAAFPTA